VLVSRPPALPPARPSARPVRPTTRRLVSRTISFSAYARGISLPLSSSHCVDHAGMCVADGTILAARTAPSGTIRSSRNRAGGEARVAKFQEGRAARSLMDGRERVGVSMFVRSFVHSFGTRVRGKSARDRVSPSHKSPGFLLMHERSLQLAISSDFKPRRRDSRVAGESSGIQIDRKCHA